MSTKKNNTIIQVSELSKTFRVPKKASGIWNSIQSVFVPKYSMVEAVKNISFEINEGEMVGFIGPNGAGKTTTLKMLSGLLYPTSGSVKMMNYTPWQRKTAFLKQFALVMGQKNQLWWNLPPSDSFLLFKEIYQLDDKQYNDTVNKLVDILDIGMVMDTPIRKVSLGQRMKCELVASLLHQPKVLLLDEPTIGLDVVMQQVIRDFLLTYNKEFNATILLTSHYMEDVKHVANRVLVINEGSLVFDGKLDQLIKTYATDRVITIQTSKQEKFEQAKKLLTKHGTLTFDHPPKLTATVPTNDSARITAKLITEVKISDIEVSEPTLEEIVRRYFSDNAQA